MIVICIKNTKLLLKPFFFFYLTGFCFNGLRYMFTSFIFISMPTLLYLNWRLYEQQFIMCYLQWQYTLYIRETRVNVTNLISLFQCVFVANLQVTARIPRIGVGSTLDISAEKTVNIGYSAGTLVSETQNWTAEYPSTIPAESTYVPIEIMA